MKRILIALGALAIASAATPVSASGGMYDPNGGKAGVRIDGNGLKNDQGMGADPNGLLGWLQSLFGGLL